ncbi:response regulator transcription factor [Poseidonocella sedimentorum]|uniref:DNA-binding response regulator, OmpR family, contains REC and winged-helix (WHTH) domain n=1 Tax=Poseidonocella sedimentorum TaxID=871652 RepID=A0A1I6DST0_9RHOB|nr:response regulator transcription factor [Poseidonocella sedimentorum]SFR08495.1 DNA-binding response regulator, OmpR family, contains REC and winged-helix (wHTH) domain [Poseidonocella sedimentorum]
MTAPARRILIVDDDREICSALARGLQLHGYETVTVNSAPTARARFEDAGFSAAIVDVMIGEDNGIALVRDVRQAGKAIPILMLSALSEVSQRAEGLAAGADDYIVKPFSFDELVARLQVQEHRAQAKAPRAATLDAQGWSLSRGARRVVLTEREFALLRLLARHAGRPLSRLELFETLWVRQGASSENVVDVYVGYLRRKLAPSGDFGFEIKTIRNQGFLLDGLPPTEA